MNVKITTSDKVVLGRHYIVSVLIDDQQFAIVGGNRMILKHRECLTKYEQDRQFDLLEAREVKKMIQQLPEIYHRLIL